MRECIFTDCKNTSPVERIFTCVARVLLHRIPYKSTQNINRRISNGITAVQFPSYKRIAAKPRMVSARRAVWYQREALDVIRLKSGMASSRREYIRLRRFHTPRKRGGYIRGFAAIPYQPAFGGLNKKSRCKSNEIFWYGQQDLNLHDCSPEPKSGASANSAMPANTQAV